MSEQQATIKQRGEASNKEVAGERKPNTAPSHALADYDGSYTHPAYRVFNLTYVCSGLLGTFHDMPFSLTHHHYDTFELKGEEAEIFTLVSFTTDTAGDIARLSVPLEAAVDPIVFQRQPATDDANTPAGA